MRDYDSLFDDLLADLSPHVDIVGPPGPKEFACIQLRQSFYKKLCPSGTNPEADAKALEKFRDINSRVKGSFPVETEEDKLLMNQFDLIVGRVCSVDQGDLCLDLEFLGSNMGVGPGMNVGASSEDFYSKLFDSTLTTTSEDLIRLYRAATMGSDFWANAEMRRNQLFGFRVVPGNTLFYASKNKEISRTAGTEPPINMLFQKGIGAFLDICLWRHFRISLATQPDKNREMARLGSLNGDMCTVDLVSASDMVGSALCRRSLSACGLNRWLERTRSPFTTLPGGEQVELNMISTMGNGFTFPLQTLIFASAVKAVYTIEGLTFDAEKLTYGVFGDDIVVVKAAYEKLLRLLHLLGFEVNEAKSFSDGPFRESCGFDYYSGRQVRGVYIKSLETTPSVYSAINRLNRWSATQGIALPRVIASLRKMLPRKRVHFVPWSESDDAGYKVPRRALPVDPKRDEFGSETYKYLAYRARKRAVPIDRQGSDAIGYSDFNEFGWGVTFLGGYAATVESCVNKPYDPDTMPGELPLAYIGLRDNDGDTKLYKARRATIPWWDWYGTPDSRFMPTSYEGWKTLVTLQTLDE